MKLLVIDPGPEQSAWVLYDTERRRPVDWAKATNDAVRTIVRTHLHKMVAIEKVESFGMPVGLETFETVYWSGRFAECWGSASGGEPIRIGRKAVKLHLCGSARAKDPNVRQALIDGFGGKEKAIGKKASPGPLYGLSGDCWAALAVAVTVADTLLPELEKAA